MADIKLNWAFSLSIDGGPRVSLAQPSKFAISAYDVIQASIPAASGTPPVAGSVTVDAQPSTATGVVQVLLISSEKYDPAVSYTVGTKKTVLDGPQVFVGSMVSALADPFPQTIKFENGTTAAVAVSIFVGRKS